MSDPKDTIHPPTQDGTAPFVERRRRQRGPDQRIIDPETHPKRYVSLVVAADYLEIDRKTLGYYLDEGKIAYVERRSRRKIAVTELVAFERRTHHQRAS